MLFHARFLTHLITCLSFLPFFLVVLSSLSLIHSYLFGFVCYFEMYVHPFQMLLTRRNAMNAKT